MVKKQEYQRKNNNESNSSGGYTQRNTREQSVHRGSKPAKTFNREASNRETPGKDVSNKEASGRENVHVRNTGRNNYSRQNYSNYHSAPRYNNRIKTEETVDDIKEDIIRIEKEIDLEIKEIRSLKL